MYNFLVCVTEPVSVCVCSWNSSHYLNVFALGRAHGWMIRHESCNPLVTWESCLCCALWKSYAHLCHKKYICPIPTLKQSVNWHVDTFCVTLYFILHLKIMSSNLIYFHTVYTMQAVCQHYNTMLFSPPWHSCAGSGVVWCHQFLLSIDI